MQISRKDLRKTKRKEIKQRKATAYLSRQRQLKALKAKSFKRHPTLAGGRPVSSSERGIVKKDSDPESEDEDEFESENEGEKPLMQKKRGIKREKEPVSDTRNQIKGMLNKVNHLNFEHLILEIISLLLSRPNSITHSEVSALLLSHTVCDIFLLETHLLVNASISTVLFHIMGSRFAATFTGSFKEVLDEALRNGSRPSALNLSSLLSYLYVLGAVSSAVLVQYINMFMEIFDELSIDILLRIFRLAGNALYQNEPQEFKSLLLRSAQKGELFKSDKYTRKVFLKETLDDIASNRVRLAKTSGNVNEVVLFGDRVKTAVLDSGKRILQPYDPDGKMLVDSGTTSKDGNFCLNDQGLIQTVSHNSFARKCQLNNHVRKVIFHSLISAVDYIDAGQKILALNLTKSQTSEISFVLIHACLGEKTFNDFYPLVAKYLGQINKTLNATLYGIFADYVQTMPELLLGKHKNMLFFCRFYGFLITHKCLSIDILAQPDNLNAQYLPTLLPLILTEVLNRASEFNDLYCIFSPLAKGELFRSHRLPKSTDKALFAANFRSTIRSSLEAIPRNDEKIQRKVSHVLQIIEI